MRTLLLASALLPLAATPLHALQLQESDKVTILPEPGFDVVVFSGLAGVSLDSFLVPVVSLTSDFSSSSSRTLVFDIEPVTGKLTLTDTLSSVIWTAENNEAFTFSANDDGAVEILRRNGSGTWSVVAQAAPNDPQNLIGGFGAIARDGILLAHGAALASPSTSGSSTAVYVHEVDSLTGSSVQRAKLTPSIGNQEYDFASSLDIDGDLLVVGAEQTDADGNDDGAAFVFRRINGTWVETQILLGTDFAGPFSSRGAFGDRVDIDGDSVFVSEPSAGTSGSTASGRVHRYEITPSGLVPRQTLADPSPVSFQRFGAWMDADQGSLVVGIGGGGSGQGVGSAVVFEEQPDGNYALATTLAPSDPTTPSLSSVPHAFGRGVSTASGRVYVRRQAQGSTFPTEIAVYAYETPYFSCNRATMSVASGGLARFTIDLPASFAGNAYLTLGSFSGTQGFDFGGLFVPLTPDTYFNLLIGSPASYGFFQAIGALDTQGDSTIFWSVPPAVPGLVGAKAAHTAVTVSPTTGLVEVIASPAVIEFLP